MHYTVGLNVFIAAPFHLRKVIAEMGRSDNPGNNNHKNNHIDRWIRLGEKIENKGDQREFRKKCIIDMNGRILHWTIPEHQ